MKNLTKSLLFISLLNLTGCASLGVKPWERNMLAKEEMQGVTVLNQKYDDHIYFSKEASSGGANLAGGGCGCN